MALGATIYVFGIELADSDRGVYESFELRAARHPSEAPDYLLTRVLAYCMEYTEGISFSNGLSTPDEPTIAIRDLTGAMRAWIDVGAPSAERLHRASKATPRVAVYTHKDVTQFVARLRGERIHRIEALEVYALDRELLTNLENRLERRMALSLTVAEKHLYVSVGEASLTGVIERVELTR
ncbi:MAG: hypothetical protein QOI59_4550 [Gammaproteobacteria bacterium]|jgi:uncharacterized protein YaeQ|nr:hypothetical protein [Gammaproteobacteria bacterium]